MKDKIAVVSNSFPAPNHPAYVFVEQLVNAFVDSGEDITVIAPQSITSQLLGRTPKLPVFSYGYTPGGKRYEIYRPKYISLSNCPRQVQKVLDYLRGAAIGRVLKRKKIDIIYTHFWENTLQVLKFAQQNQLPLFVACGEGDEAMEQLHSSLSKKECQVIRETVNGVISVSNENKRKCIAYGWIRPDNVDVFPNCVNTDLFKPKEEIDLKKELGIGEDDFTLAFVGSFIHRKGAKRLAEAITSLNDPHIKSIFIGKDRAGDSEMPECEGIVFKGPLDHDEIARYLNCADVFVLPTLKEGCCNAIIEAMASGLPVISSDGPFNDDILDESNSIRIDPMNIEAIAAAIKKMKEDKEFTQKLKSNIISKRPEYSLKGRAERILDFINRHK